MAKAHMVKKKSRKGGARAKAFGHLLSCPHIAGGDFDVLHLSDLHIAGTTLSDKYDKLLQDISTETKSSRNIVVVVTGDIASQGNVKHSSGAIVSFFRRLKAAISARVIDVELVPGNHDIDRRYLFNTDSYATALREYSKLAQSVYAIFGLRNHDLGVYGASRICCGNRSVCFLRLDTSWYYPEKDFKGSVKAELSKQMLGSETVEARWRVICDCKNARVAEYRRQQKIGIEDALGHCKDVGFQRNEPVELVIALAHHPLSWLVKSSCESYADYLAQLGVPEVNIWMCGHAHDIKLHYDNDDNQSTVILMTGVGNDERSRSLHRYSIYNVCPVRNVCSIVVRASSVGKKFDYDDTLLPTETSHQTGHFCYPLRTRAPGSIIQLNTHTPNPIRELFVDQHIVRLMSNLTKRIRNLEEKVGVGVELHALSWRKAKKVFPQMGSGLRVFLFLNFLRQLTNEVVAALLMVLDDDGKRLTDVPLFGFDQGNYWADWRVHFRACGLKALPGKKRFDTYRCVAKTAAIIPFGTRRNMSGIKDMPWNSLIGAADSHPNKTLIRSVNYLPKSKRTKWDDYLTSIPVFKRNVISTKGGDRPLLTFGLSVKSHNYESSFVSSRILYLLEYFDINKFISTAINGYIRRTKFNISDLMK